MMNGSSMAAAVSSSPSYSAYIQLPTTLYTSSSSSSSIRIRMEAAEADGSTKKKIFVAGSTGNTGKRIVELLLSRGCYVRAGALDPDKAATILPKNPSLHIVRADVTEGPDKLAEAIGDAGAVICATGFRRSWDIFAPWKVDNLGTVNLVEACRKADVRRFILISSILVNGAAMGQFLNPAYIVLNLLGLTLVAKLQAEQYIRKSGINYTIVRPGGLRNDPPEGNIVMEPEDTLYEGSISRDQVAEVAVEAFFCSESYFKVVEIVSRIDAPKHSLKDLFSAIKKGLDSVVAEYEQGFYSLNRSLGCKGFHGPGTKKHEHEMEAAKERT